MARPLLLSAVTRRARTNREGPRRSTARTGSRAGIWLCRGPCGGIGILARTHRIGTPGTSPKSAHSARNAQAHALRGFLLSAQNRIDAARAEFQTAIDLDGALGNAWLGRGLCAIRQGHDDAGRLDLQIAATVEPNRSMLHSYLGKAFSEIGDNRSANKDLARAKELDLNDSTPFLYSAIQRKQENRYNEAIDDLEKSIELNRNRRLYRSEFLLDQDLAIRNANLASIYRNNGMIEQSVREAVRAVNNDYASAPAHLFLSNSYNELRDPTTHSSRVRVRVVQRIAACKHAFPRRWRAALAIRLAAGIFEAV
jgi:tetratricopeptide (TPR) repeat protein